MLKLPFPFPVLAETMYITSSSDEYHNISKYNVLEKESFFYFAVYDQNTIFTCILSGNTCENRWRFDEV